VLPQEQLFDVTDLQSAFGDQESHLVSKCGHLEVAFAYDAPMRKMTVRVLQARDIPARDRGGATHTQVHTSYCAKSVLFSTTIEWGRKTKEFQCMKIETK
jgi:hypothetical protein